MNKNYLFSLLCILNTALFATELPDSGPSAATSQCTSSMATIKNCLEFAQLLINENEEDALKMLEQGLIDVNNKLQTMKRNDTTEQVLHQSLLFFALALQKPKIAQRLIAYGADVNEGETLSDGSNPITPLFMACSYGFTDCVTELLKKNAALNTKCKSSNGSQSTPLCSALDNKHPEIALQLIAHGADVNEKNTANNGSAISPLYKACDYGFADCVTALIEKNVDMDFTNILSTGDKETALFIALYNENPTIALLLLNHGADPRKVTKSADGKNTASSYHALLYRIQSTHTDYKSLFNLFHQKFREQKDDCCICLESTTTKDIVVTPCCNKSIDKECMTALREREISECPTCKDTLFGRFEILVHRYVEPELSECSKLPIDLLFTIHSFMKGKNNNE